MPWFRSVRRPIRSISSVAASVFASSAARTSSVHRTSTAAAPNDASHSPRLNTVSRFILNHNSPLVFLIPANQHVDDCHIQCKPCLMNSYEENVAFGSMSYRCLWVKKTCVNVSSENTASIRKQWLIKTNGLCSKTFISY